MLIVLIRPEQEHPVTLVTHAHKPVFTTDNLLIKHQKHARALLGTGVGRGEVPHNAPMPPQRVTSTAPGRVCGSAGVFGR